MQPVQDEQQTTDDARFAEMIRTIRGTAEQLNVAVLDSVLGAAGGTTTAAAASELRTLARRLAAAADTFGRRLGTNRNA